MLRQTLALRSKHAYCWNMAKTEMAILPARNLCLQFLQQQGHVAFFLPKFHPEMNPIERVWAQAKRYTKAYCKYTLPSLRQTIPKGLDSVTLDNIKNFHRKSRDYMFAYFEGHVAGNKLETQIKQYKSHRRVGRHA